MKKVLHIGFDDTDSLKGSCTTYLAVLILKEIYDYIDFLDFPNLIRLNPNIPFKTRGNGAVAIRIYGEKQDLENCKEIVVSKVRKLSEVRDENTNPGIIFLEGDVPTKVIWFSQRAMWDVLSIKEAEEFAQTDKIEVIKFKNGRGIIGALGAIGNQLRNDFTYELLSYRTPQNFGSTRKVLEESVFQADKKTPLTFNNIDYEYKSILITPRGADPVFTGIRGETVEAVMNAWEFIIPLEDIAFKMVFRTNQHTNEHFVKKFNINDLKPHLSVIIQGEISTTPYYIEGSHLIFSLKDATAEIDCAAYEPTKRFRGELSQLIIGDKVTIFGGVRPPGVKHPLTVNVERLIVNELTEQFDFENPMCENCGTRLKSAGKNKGYKCPNCSTRFRTLEPIKRNIERKISIGDHLPPLIAHRHLTRPSSREFRDNTGREKSKEEVNRLIKNLLHPTKTDSIKK